MFYLMDLWRALPELELAVAVDHPLAAAAQRRR